MIESQVELLFKRFWRRMKKRANVIGFDGILRPKQIDGKIQKGWLTWRIYVEKKLPKQYIQRRDVIPETLSLYHTKPLKNKFGNIDTDVIAIGKPVIPPLLGMDKSTQDRWRPLELGISSTHYQGTACSLNAFFLHETKYIKEVLQASNMHCFGMEGDAKVGDAIMNPSPYDGGKLPDDKTGEYALGVPITFDSFTCPFRNFVTRRLAFWTWLRPVAGENDVDISFATVDVDWKNKIAREKTGFKGWADPIEGQPVAKCGRTTDRTQGVWESTSMFINCQYRRGIAFMNDIAMADIECSGGDSGSPMYNPNTIIYNAALFAGSEQGKTFGCKISNIMNRAQVKLITEE